MDLELDVDRLWDRETILSDIIANAYQSGIGKGVILFFVRRYFEGQHGASLWLGSLVLASSAFAIHSASCVRTGTVVCFNAWVITRVVDLLLKLIIESLHLQLRQEVIHCNRNRWTTIVVVEVPSAIHGAMRAVDLQSSLSLDVLKIALLFVNADRVESDVKLNFGLLVLVHLESLGQHVDEWFPLIALLGQLLRCNPLGVVTWATYQVQIMLLWLRLIRVHARLHLCHLVIDAQDFSRNLLALIADFCLTSHNFHDESGRVHAFGAVDQLMHPPVVLLSSLLGLWRVR